MFSPSPALAQAQTASPKKSPAEKDVYRARATANMKVGKYLDALKDLNQSIQIYGKSPEKFITRAKVLMGLRCYPESIRDLETATQIAPSSRRAILLRALYKSDTGNRQGSVEDFLRAVELSPKGPILLESDKDVVKGLVHSAESDVQKEPDARSFLRLAFANLVSGNYAASAKASARALDEEKVLPHALVVSAYAKFFLKQNDAALADARKAASLRRHDLWYHFPLINLYLRAGMLDKALSEYDALIKKESNNSTFYACRAEVYRLLNNNARAMEELSTAIKYQALQAVLYKRRASLYIAQHNTKAALSDLGKAVKLLPDKGEFYEDRAKILVQQGDYAKAETDFSSAIARSYNLVKNYEARSACYRKLGRTAAASADLVEARKASD